MLRFLLLAVLLACVSAFVPPATLAQRSVVGRAASVEMGASKGNIDLLKKPKAAPKKAAAKVRRRAHAAGCGAPRSHAAPHSRTWRAQKIDAAPTFSPPVRPTSAQAAAPLPNVFMQMDTDSSGSLTLEEVLWFAQGTGASQNQAAQTFRSQDIDGDGVISWHEFDGPKTGPMGVDVKSLKDEP